MMEYWRTIGLADEDGLSLHQSRFVRVTPKGGGLSLSYRCIELISVGETRPSLRRRAKHSKNHAANAGQGGYGDKLRAELPLRGNGFFLASERQ
jgi:hypothetical protein